MNAVFRMLAGSIVILREKKDLDRFITEPEEDQSISLTGKQNLREMARFSGFGISIEVRSDDHGIFGNESSPAHVHVLNNGGKELGEMVLTKNAPKKPSDILWYRTENPPLDKAATIVKLANSQSKASQKAGIRMTVWQNAINTWFIFHEN